MTKLSFATWTAIASLALPLPSLFAQHARPAGQNNPNVLRVNRLAFERLPALNRMLIAAQDQISDAQVGVPPRFAIANAVDVNPWTAGTWEDLDARTSLWRLRIEAPGSSHVNLGFQRFKLTPGARLMVYASDYSHVLRPYTGSDHNPDGQFWTPVVNGDEIVIEVRVPTAELGKLQLNLTQVNSGYRFFGAGPSAVLPEGSGSCNVNVVCPQGAGWEDEIASVAVYSLNGFIACTGAMINNTAQDNRNLFLTADHCGVTSGNASSMVVYWNYEEPTCGGNGVGLGNQTTSGATFRAGNGASDFTLVELNSTPSASWDVHYAGWNRASSATSSAVCIHHPSGDSKKISFENNPTSLNGNYIRVNDWDVGTTEPGSSGSPLFDPNHRIVGQLFGGLAACGNNQYDDYGRISSSWTGGGSNGSRLSNWLDPLGTGAITVDTIGPGGGGPTGPANDECSAAIAVTNGTNGSYSSVGATNSSPAWTCAGGGGNDVWFAYTATCTGTATFNTCTGSTYDTAIEAFSGSCGSLNLLGCNDDTCNLQSQVTINTTQGSTYYVRVGGYQGASGSFNLSVSCSGTTGLANDECSGAISVGDGVNGPFSSATATDSAPAWSCSNPGSDVWFVYNASCSGTAQIDVCSATLDYDSVIEVFGGSCGSLNLLACDDDTCGFAAGSQVTINTTQGANYFIRVGGWQGATGNFDVSISCTPVGGTATATPYGTGCNDRARSFYEDPAPNTIDLGVQRLQLALNGQGGYDVTHPSFLWQPPSSPDLGLADDAVSTQTLPFTLSYPGGSTNQIGICSNGYIWLNGTTSTADWNPSIAEFANEPARLCPVWTDYDPSSGGSVHYQVLGGAAYITWNAIPEFGVANSSSFQCVIQSNGTIEFRYLTVQNTRVDRETYVGFSSGNGARLRDPVDLSALGLLTTNGPDATPLTLGSTNTPQLGATLNITIDDIPAGSLGGAVMMGFTQFNPGIDLTVIDMPGCFLYSPGDLTLNFATGGSSASVNFQVANDAGIIGLHLYATGATISPGQNALGVVTSNGMDFGVDVN